MESLQVERLTFFYMMRKGMLSSLKTSLIDMAILLKSNQDNLSDIIISEKKNIRINLS